jgi:glutathione peroxidase
MIVTGRREMLALLACWFATPAIAQTRVSSMTAYGFSFAGLQGGDIRLVDHAGKPILIVNTASLCGYTPQYAGLEQLWSRFRSRGLLVVGVPSNEFGGQEPGSAADIGHTAHAQYGVTFPMAAKVSVRGPNAHPFYKWAALQRPLDVPRWNFHKYLVGRDGRIAAAFASEIEPMDARVGTAVAKELSAD